jgi:NAD(P)-dependent dehydrogenase (short-subunit alcohol dehydrogenase family)
MVVLVVLVVVTVRCGCYYRHLRLLVDCSARQEALLAQVPLGRWGTPAEVADAVCYVAGATYMTGQMLQIDGGMCM